MENKKWWEQGALKSSKLLLNSWMIDSVKPEEIPGIFKRYASIGCNLTQVHVMKTGIGHGTVTDGFFFKSATEPNTNPDLLLPFVEEGHKNGVNVLVYFNCASFLPETRYKYPEWLSYDEKGNPNMSMYDTGMAACVNSPEFRKWQTGVIKDLAKYDIKGLFLDGNCFRTGTCYCPNCRRLYREQYGSEMPSKSDKKNPEWRKLRQFQIDSVASYYRCMSEALKEEKPDALFYVNSALRSPNWPTGKQNRKIMQYMDALLAEGGFLYYDIKSPIWKTECENKLFVTQSGGKPVVSAMAIDHKKWNWYQLPAAEWRLMMYGAVAAGAHASAGTTGLFNNADYAIDIVKGVFDVITRNEASLYPTINKAKVAIVWSNVNADFYMGGSVSLTDFQQGVKTADAGDLHQEFEGFYDSSFRRGIASDVIDEVSVIDGSLKKYNVVILPNIACLSDKEMDALREFVKNGGTLISSYETSLFNEYGEKRDNFGLSDMFGVRLEEDNTEGPLLWDYVITSEGNNYLSSMLEDYVYLPSPKYRLKTKPETADKILDCAQVMKGCYDGFPGRTDNGFMYINNYGEGRSVYFSGTIGQAMMEWHFFEYFNILDKIYKEYSGQEIALENAAESVSINIRENTATGEILIYLINYTAAMTRPIREVTLLENVMLRTKLDIQSIKTLVDQDNFKLEIIDGESVITVKKLKEFEVISVKGRL